MSTGDLALLIPLVAIPFGCVTAALLAGLLFPTTRQAMANWLHRRSGGSGGSESVIDQLVSANAQLAALRGEVYALRCEVATLSQALPAAHLPALPPPNAGPSTSPAFRG